MVRLSLLAILFSSPFAAAQDQEKSDEPQGHSGYEDVPQFGGNMSTPGTLKEDDAQKQPRFRFNSIQRVLEPYFDWKRGLEDDHGLAFGMDYSTASLWASDSPGEDDATSGMFRFFGSWALLGRGTPDTGSFVWKVEHRHRYTDIAPSSLASQTGYVGIHEAPFNEDDTRLTNLYWSQRFREGELTLLGGLVDLTDYLDVYALASPWTGFFNLVFSTGSASIPLPGDGGLGFAAGGAVGDNFYAVAGIGDTNADPTDPNDSVDSFVDDHEYFTHVELGWVSSWERRYLDNAHVTVWHVDDRDDAGTPDGRGVNFSWSHYYDDKWLPFVRGGWADDGGSLLEKSISVGFGYQPEPHQDLLGLGLNWGEPNDDTFGADLDDQYTAELFYRIQFSENFALTPDVQYIVDPALNPDDDTLWVLGLRTRLSF